MNPTRGNRRLHPLRINTERSLQDYEETRTSIEFFEATEQIVPSFVVSSPHEQLPASISPAPSPKPRLDSGNRPRNESRKLLAHVLNQLHNRPTPPLIYTTIETPGNTTETDGQFMGAILESVKVAVKLNQGKQKSEAALRTQLEEDSDEDDTTFTTETTYDLLFQLKDVLVISKMQGWQIFDDRDVFLDANIRRKSPRISRRPQSALQTSGRRSRSPSPALLSTTSSPELLSTCISVLESIILQDCRYKITQPRPTRPPNALQLLVLDVMQFLLFAHRNHFQVFSKLVCILTPAFSTFPSEIHSRLLAFFEQNVVRHLLEELKRQQDMMDKTIPTKKTPPEVGGVIPIHVDEVIDARNLGKANATQSSNSPHQSPIIYYLSSIISPLLSAVLDHVDVFGDNVASIQTLSAAWRLFDLIHNMKFDAYLDFLHVAAYHGPLARRGALRLLMVYWPESIGHVVVAKPFAPPAYKSNRELSNHNAHQFLPWLFPITQGLPNVGAARQHDCRVCSRTVVGFGILCGWCMCAVHFDCYDYPEGNQMVEYACNSTTKRVAMFKYSPTPFSKRTRKLSDQRTDHTFHNVNLFTLSLCMVCQGPLWGLVDQGLRCSSCSQFTHHSCAQKSAMPPCKLEDVQPDSMSIEWSALRSSCINYYQDVFTLTKEELNNCTYEEVSIIYSVLSLQLQLITNGVALGSVVVIQRGKSTANSANHQINTFELHKVMDVCAILRETRPMSPVSDEFLQENRLHRRDHSLMHHWSHLMYLISSVKTSQTQEQVPTQPSSEFLQVGHSGPVAYTNDPPTAPHESMTLVALRSTLSQEFTVSLSSPVRFLLTHMLHLGLFSIDVEDLFSTPEAQTRCTFTLPLLLDLSTNVEILVSSVESCLRDLDLTINEVGLLLLTRKLWPNGLSSTYALNRLSRAAIFWILSEDESLATILREYIPHQRNLPGIRADSDLLTWPIPNFSRPAPMHSTNNGGDYHATRRLLLHRYVGPWLTALHDQDPHTYAILLFEICLEHAQEGSLGIITFANSSDERTKQHLLDMCDKSLRAILKLSQVSMTLTIFDDLFIHWLDLISRSEMAGQPISSLSRLLPRENDLYQRSSSFYAGQPSPHDVQSAASLNPWRTLANYSSESKEALSRALSWLYMLVVSNVEISTANFLHFPRLLARFESPMSDALALTRAVMVSIWLQSIGRDGLQRLFGLLHLEYSQHIIRNLSKNTLVDESLTFVRQSLGSCLLLYGVERATLQDAGFLREDEVRDLPSRRKQHARGVIALDPLVMDSNLLDVLQEYIQIGVDVLSCWVVKFLELFMTRSPYMESHEVDNFILKNGAFLANCAWKIYEVQRHEISAVRPSFLLRILVVDPSPFRHVLDPYFVSVDDWEGRLVAVMRLYRIILDVLNPAFRVDDRPWRSSILDIIYHFFNALWLEDREEIRVASKTFTASLLPTHFDAITLSWDEFLVSRPPIHAQTKLVSFLIQLHPYFPEWKLLSWHVLLACLELDEASQVQRTISTQSSSVVDSSDDPRDDDPVSLKVPLFILAFQLIADGAPVDHMTLVALKVHFLRLLDVLVDPRGQSFYLQLREVEELPTLVLPCVQSLIYLFDSVHTVDLPPAYGGMSEGKNPQVLVGAAFVDVLLAITAAVKDPALPILTAKGILESLCIVIYKHDFESANLKAMQPYLKRAITHTLDLVVQDTTYETRQIALSVVQGFVKRCSSFMGSIIHAALESSAKLIASQSHHSQDGIVAQSRRFMETTLMAYASHGLFVTLLKRKSLGGVFFSVLRQVTDTNATLNANGNFGAETLRDTLLRDTMARVADGDIASLHTVLANLQAFIEVVHHEGYPVDLLAYVGQCLIQIARRAAESSDESLDPSPLLQIPAILIQHNRAKSRELLSYVETVLRISLNRLNLPSSAISKLLSVTTALFRKSPKDVMVHINPTAAVVTEILIDGLRMKYRVNPMTLKSMIEALNTGQDPQAELNNTLAIAEYSILFLCQHPWQSSQSGDDFNASVAVAGLVLRGAKHDPSIIMKVTNYIIEFAQRTSRQPLAIRAWNLLLLAALQDASQNWSASFLRHLSDFANLHHQTLKWHLQPDTAMPETATTDINHAYISLKLWILMAGHADHYTALTTWNELWPPFENLINSLEYQKGLTHSMLCSLVAGSVADLHLFLATLHSPLVLQTSSHVNLLNRLKDMGRSGRDVTVSKITRALRALTDPPSEVSLQVLINQIGKEIVATEKVRMLETKKELNLRIN